MSPTGAAPQARIAFIGGGNMARALIGGLLSNGAAPAAITVGETAPALREALARDFAVRVTADNSQALRGARVVVLAVKPQDAAGALAPLRVVLEASRPLLVSIAAGLRVRDLAAWCGAAAPIVRAMPKRPALLAAGVTGLYAAADVSDEQRALADGLMLAVGRTVWVEEESALDIVTALSGSGPAYFFRLAELLVESAVGLGLDREASRTLAIETLRGAGVLAHASDGDLARLRAEVTSKGGTTEAALQVMEEANLRGIVAAAMHAATQRARELAERFGAAPPDDARS
jgi:pyrroline-5-carboxylate reductase